MIFKYFSFCQKKKKRVSSFQCQKGYSKTSGSASLVCSQFSSISIGLEDLLPTWGLILYLEVLNNFIFEFCKWSPMTPQSMPCEHGASACQSTYFPTLVRWVLSCPGTLGSFSSMSSPSNYCWPPSPSRGLGPDRRSPLLPETTQTGSTMGCALVTGGWKTASSHLLLIQVPSTFQHGGCTLPSEAHLPHGFPQVAVLGAGKISGMTSLPPTKTCTSPAAGGRGKQAASGRYVCLVTEWDPVRICIHWASVPIPEDMKH